MTSPESTEIDEPTRRSFFKKTLAVLIGGIVMIVPAAAGVLVFLDPLRRRRGGGAEFVPVAPLEAVPADGSPQKFQIVADRTDAWNMYKQVPVGAVYLKRTDDKKVVAFNVVCPHAGCFVDVAADGRSFRCPCHNSGFNPDGSNAPGSVSPRGMDELEVDADALAKGMVSIRFQNFSAGTHDKIPVG